MPVDHPSELPADAGPSHLGWDDALAAAFAPFSGTHRPARVCRVDRGAVDALVADDALTALRARVPHDVTPPAVGDWIATTRDSVGWAVDVVLPRRTAIERADVLERSRPQVLAANVDLVLIAMPVFPEPKTGLVERMVTLAWDSGATPLVVLTKADLSPEAAAIAADLAEAAPGVDVVSVSAVADDGLVELAPYLQPGRTLCLLGKSGAGKSTLVNALAGGDVAATSGIRSDGKGRHTTSHRELFLLPGGSVLVDTPGLRGAGLWVTAEGLDRAFDDVERLVDECRFNDCGHTSEPGCAVLAAVEDGSLPERRLESWRKLQREARWMASRTDARLRAEQRRSWKVVHKELRRSGRIRP